MARPLRIEYPGAWYHVLQRGAARRPIFLSREDRGRFLALLGDIRRVWNVEVHAYSLMDNHYHLLIHTPEGNLSRAMRHVDGVYTQRFNRAHGRDGPLFRGRFKSIVIERDSYLQELVRYIHLNPLRAGASRSPAGDPWTSHRAYLFPKERPPWLVVDEVLSAFGKRHREALQRFDRFVRAGIPEYVERRYAGAKLPSIIGSDAFRDWIKVNFVSRVKKNKEIPDARAACQRTVALPAVAQFAASAYGMNRRELRGRPSPVRNEARSMAIWLMRHIGGAGHREIAEAMGGIGGGAVAKSLQRFDEALRRDKALAEKAERFAEHILSNVQT